MEFRYSSNQTELINPTTIENNLDEFYGDKSTTTTWGVGVPPRIYRVIINENIDQTFKQILLDVVTTHSFYLRADSYCKPRSITEGHRRYSYRGFEHKNSRPVVCPI